MAASSSKFVYKGVSFRYKTQKDGNISITGFNNDADKVYFPANINGTPVVSISTSINGNNYQATEIVIEEGIERIEKFCFNDFRKLKSVTLPSSIIYIGRNAFRDNLAINFYIPLAIDKSIIDLLASNSSYKISQPDNIKRNENNKVDDIKIIDKPEPLIEQEITSAASQ